MGYYSSMSGSFEIIPAPRTSDFDLRELEEQLKPGWGLECVSVEFDKESTRTIEEDGTEVLRSKAIRARINSCEASDHKHYYIVETLQAIVDMLGKDRQYKGYFECHGEDGEQWRYGIVNGIATEFKPGITWPAEVS